jgi:hypothetical protein
VSVAVYLERDALSVSIGGGDAWLSFKRNFLLPVADIDTLTVMTTGDARRTLGFRLLGTSIPRLVTAGWFAYSAERGTRQWWLVRTGREVLVVNTFRKSPKRLVIETHKCHEIVAAWSTTLAT